MARRRRLKSAEITLARTTEVLDLRAGEAVGIKPSEQLRAAPIDVPDPENPDQTIRLLRSTRDPLTWMHSRGAIDEPQRIAGEHWRKCWYHSQFGVGSIDTTKEAVDGGAIYEPIPDLRALEFLAKCRRELGYIGNWVIQRCLADNLFPKEIARLFGQTAGDREIRYWTRRVRESLQTVSLVFTVRS